MRAFKKMDVNGDGYISHSELEKALTTVSCLKQCVSDRCATNRFTFRFSLQLLSELSDVVQLANWATPSTLVCKLPEQKWLNDWSAWKNHFWSGGFPTKKKCRILQKGEKMTTEEVNAIFSLLDINKDGKLEYAEVSSSLKWLPFLLNLFPLLYINACQFIISVRACTVFFYNWP